MLSLAHRPGHLGRDQTVRRVMGESTVQECTTRSANCAEPALNVSKRASTTFHQPLSNPCPSLIRHSSESVGPLPTTAEGNRFVLIIMDYATRWPEAIALWTTESTAIADQLMILFNRTCIPEEILTDCGRNLINRLMT